MENLPLFNYYMSKWTIKRVINLKDVKLNKEKLKEYHSLREDLERTKKLQTYYELQRHIILNKMMALSNEILKEVGF